jgi:hypothetical protein
VNQATGSRILNLTRESSLSQSDYFAEHEAILLAPTWDVLGVFSTTVPVLAEQELDRRSAELETFFENAGLLVVLLTAGSKRLSAMGAGYFDNHYWWTRELGLRPLPSPLVVDGTGGMINPLEPGHSFEAYLESAPPYKARLDTSITAQSQVTVLATNRAGEPIAAEIAVEAGSVVIVPPPANDAQMKLLMEAIEATLKTRFGVGFEWRVPEELELEQERLHILGELRDKRAALDQKRAEVQRIKAEIFQTIEVRRALNYWREATGPGATPKKAMYALHAMLEMFDGYFSTGRPEVAKILGISHNSMKRITELANRRTLNLRHTTGGTPEDIDPGEYERILREAHDIVQAFINWNFREAAKPPVTA